MKRILLIGLGLLATAAVPAVAADIPMKAPLVSPAVAPGFSWTGFYIGVNGGYAFGGRDSVLVNETVAGVPFVAGTWPGFGTFGDLRLSGGFGGGQIGYNWQMGSWLLGFEADIQGAGIRSSQSVTLPYIVAPSTITIASSSRVDWFGTVRARAGWAFDRTLLYVTGGLAYGNHRYSVNMTDTPGFLAAINSNTTRVGFAVGGGAEWALGQNWTVKAEYQYINLGRYTLGAVETFAGLPTAFAISTEARPDFHTVRLGINYLFNAGPVMARY